MEIVGSHTSKYCVFGGYDRIPGFQIVYNTSESMISQHKGGGGLSKWKIRKDKKHSCDAMVFSCLNDSDTLETKDRDG